jgi:hypothetical protein
MQRSILTGKTGLAVEKWALGNKLDRGFARSLWDSIDEPDELPYMLEGLVKGFSKLRKGSKEAVRNGLIRVQIHCSIHSNSEPIKVSKQLYVAQVLERLFFGSNKLLSEGPGEEEEGR